MAKTNILKPTGEKGGSVELADSLFGVTPNMAVIHLKKTKRWYWIYYI
jgi:hypothetical protein